MRSLAIVCLSGATVGAVLGLQGYLTLSRTAETLSGGESQRIRLATQIGSRLVGVLYVLDEPSIGLHQRDNYRLLGTLKELRDLGNTVLVVEHDEETIMEADYVVDRGPGAGERGGEVVAAGPDEPAKLITATVVQMPEHVGRMEDDARPVLESLTDEAGRSLHARAAMAPDDMV